MEKAQLFWQTYLNLEKEVLEVANIFILPMRLLLIQRGL